MGSHERANMEADEVFLSYNTQTHTLSVSKGNNTSAVGNFFDEHNDLMPFFN